MKEAEGGGGISLHSHHRLGRGGEVGPELQTCPVVIMSVYLAIITTIR